MWPCIVISFLKIKPTTCTTFSNLFLELNSTCFGQFLHPSSGVFHCTHSNGICHTGLLAAVEQDGTSWFCSTAVSKHVWHIPLLCVQWKTPDDGWRNCPKHVQFHSQKYFWESSESSWFYFKKGIFISIFIRSSYKGHMFWLQGGQPQATASHTIIILFHGQHMLPCNLI